MKRLNVLMVLATLMAAGAQAAVMIEAEAFEKTGGWVVDQQFMDLMGSPFLMAHGLGEPVADAETTVELPAAGTYRVWVRTRDWVAPWKARGAPGKFQLLLNGKPLNTPFGTEGADWHWQDGGRVKLAANFKLSLHDLTGFNGRCDAILFSPDLKFVPPDGGEALAALRGKFLGWDAAPVDGGQYDLVVVGGGIAGCSAAVTAARNGMTVAMIQDRPVLGGNGSSEVRVWHEGHTNQKPFPHIGDVVNEMVRPKAGAGSSQNARDGDIYDDNRKLQVVLAEPNITLMLEHRGNQVEMKDGRIAAVIAQHTRSGKRTRVSARWVLDSTGDGVIGHLAGADFEITEKGHMGASNLWNLDQVERNEYQLKCECEDEDPLSLNFVRSDNPKPFPRCPWAVDLSDRDFPGRNGKTGQWGDPNNPLVNLGNWYWESGFDLHPIDDMERVRDQNLRAMFGAWDTLKNVDGLYPNHRLKWAAFIAGKRESRRLLGDVILSADDFRNQTAFPDPAYPCNWHIDIHDPHPEFVGEDEMNAFISRATVGKKYSYEGPYWAPYRTLYSRNVPNLFMAGRNVSVTHEGLGPVRVMKTTGMMGEIVGMAAAICKQHDCMPRDVYASHLDELKDFMRQGGKQRRNITLKAMDFQELLQPVPDSAKFIDDEWYIWGGSVVEADGRYHMFYSRWPRKLGFNAWLTHSEVAHAVSDSPQGPFQHVDVALPVRGAEFWDGLNTHNPTVHFFDGKYYLYYTGNTGDGKAMQSLNMTHRNNQRIGVAVADSPNGPWKRFDHPLVEMPNDPEAHDALMMANPSIARRDDGTYVLVYKCVGKKKPLPFGGPVVHMVATAHSPTGPFAKHPDPIFTSKESQQFPAEDPYIWFQDGTFWAIVKDMHGAFTKAGQALVLFESGDGIDWQLAENPLVSTREIHWESGTAQKVKYLERPQLLLKDGHPAALYCAAAIDLGHSFNVHIPLRQSAQSPNHD